MYLCTDHDHCCLRSTFTCEAAHQVGLSILSLTMPYVDIPEEMWGFLMDPLSIGQNLLCSTITCHTTTSTVAPAAIYNAMVVKRYKRHVIMECFNFDPSKQVREVRRKLQSLLVKQEEMVLRGDSEDERRRSSENLKGIKNRSS